MLLIWSDALMPVLIYLHVRLHVQCESEMERGVHWDWGRLFDRLNTGCVTSGVVGPPLLLCCVTHRNAPLNPPWQYMYCKVVPDVARCDVRTEMHSLHAGLCVSKYFHSECRTRVKRRCVCKCHKTSRDTHQSGFAKCVNLFTTFSWTCWAM